MRQWGIGLLLAIGLALASAGVLADNVVSEIRRDQKLEPDA